MAPNLLLGCLTPLCLGAPGAAKRHPDPPAAIRDFIFSKGSAVAIITGLYSTNPNPKEGGPLDDDDSSNDPHPASSASSLIDPNNTPIVSAPCCYYEGIGVLIYPSLVLTTHSTIPSPTAAENAEFTLRVPRTEDTTTTTNNNNNNENPNASNAGASDGEQRVEADTMAPSATQDSKPLQRKFLPHVFFATCSKLNITVIGCEYVNPDLHALGLKSTIGESLVAGSKTYILGHDKNNGGPTDKLSIGSASVTSTSNTSIVLVPSQTHECWLPGSAGFDEKGNFSFLVTETQPTKDLKIGALPIHTIKEWLEPHWHSVKPQVNNSISSTRRATYSGPQCKPIIISEIVTDVGGSKVSNNGKKDGLFRHSHSEVIRRDHNDAKNNKNPPNKGSCKLDTIVDEDKHISAKQTDDAKGETFAKVKSMRDETYTKEINEKMNMLTIGEDGRRRTQLEGSRGSVKLREQDPRIKKRKSVIDRNAPGVDVGRKLSIHEAFKQERCSLQIKPSDK